MELFQGDLIIRGIQAETDAVFTTDHYGAFNVTSCMRFAQLHGKRTLAQLYVPHVLKCMTNCDLDMEHSFELMKLSDRELYARTLLLYVELGDGTHMLIDGNHRLAELARRSMEREEYLIEVKSIVITLEEAQRFQVQYFMRDSKGEYEITGAEMLAQINGVYSNRDGSIRDARPEYPT